MKRMRWLALPLRALLRVLAKLLRPATKRLPSPSLDRLRELPGPGQVAARLRPGSSETGGKDTVPAHEADLPEVLTQADGRPIQHATVVGVPVEIAYNQFTQFESFPEFMHAVAKVEQVDAARVEFELRRWGLQRSWTAHIVDQRPEERIAWRSVEGMRLAGVTTFHSISDRLTRIDVDVVVEPAGTLQRVVRGTGLLDRLLAHELQRFKAFIEMREEETGAWRGYIADGEVVDEDEYFGWEPDGASANGASAEKSKGSGARRSRARGRTGGSRSRA